MLLRPWISKRVFTHRAASLRLAAEPGEHLVAAAEHLVGGILAHLRQPIGLVEVPIERRRPLERLELAAPHRRCAR